MLKEAIATGETVEQAFEMACKELGVETHEAELEILKLPVKKTLGLFGGNPAKVRAFVKNSPAKAAADYLQEVLQKMNVFDTTIAIVEEENGAKLSLSGNDVGFIIGHRGETLDALQYLSGLVANHVENTYYRITLNVGNYREKRQDTLEKLGRKMAEKSVRERRNFSLEPMNPYERRLIHTAVQTVEGAKSWSEGEESARHVVVGPVEGEMPGRYRNHPDGRNRSSKGRGQGKAQYDENKGKRQRIQRSQSAQNTKTAEVKTNHKKLDSGAASLYGRIEKK